MRTITTSKGTYDVDYAWAPTFDGACMIQMHDLRRIPEIANEFDMLEKIVYYDSDLKREYEWIGYTRIRDLYSKSDGTVQITLEKEPAT